VVQDPGRAGSDRTPWKLAADGRTVFRLVPPIVIWWAWVAFAVLIIALVAIPGHDYFSIELTAGLAAVTAIAYATTLRPRVLADDDGVHVLNPLRNYRIGWRGLSAIYLGDMVELSCARPAPRKDKTVYCWALYSGRRARLRARMRAGRGPSLLFGFGREPAAGEPEPSRPDTVVLMAAELGRLSEAAGERGAPAAVLQSTWAWWPLAFVVIPAAALLGLALAR
jgi:hypothetical protein